LCGRRHKVYRVLQKVSDGVGKLIITSVNLH